MNIWRSLFKLGACYMDLEFSTDEFFVVEVNVYRKQGSGVGLSSYLYREEGNLDGDCVGELAPQAHECDKELVL